MVPLNRRSPSTPGLVLMATRVADGADEVLRACAAARSRPGLDTSRVYWPGIGSSSSSMREMSRVSLPITPMSTPPGAVDGDAQDAAGVLEVVDRDLGGLHEGLDEEAHAGRWCPSAPPLVARTTRPDNRSGQRKGVGPRPTPRHPER